MPWNKRILFRWICIFCNGIAMCNNVNRLINLLLNFTALNNVLCFFYLALWTQQNIWWYFFKNHLTFQFYFYIKVWRNLFFLVDIAVSNNRNLVYSPKKCSNSLLERGWKSLALVRAKPPFTLSSIHYATFDHNRSCLYFSWQERKS